VTFKDQLADNRSAPKAVWHFITRHIARVRWVPRSLYRDRALPVAGDNDHRKNLDLGPDGRPKPKSAR
jgi:hypothetical protein